MRWPLSLLLYKRIMVEHLVSSCSQPWLTGTSDTSDRNPIRLYLGLGPVCAAFCQTSDQGIRCPRYLIPRIWSGNFCQWHSEVHNPPCPLRAIHPPLRARIPSPHPLSAFPPPPAGGNVPRIPWIPRIEAACRSLSEVSTVDLIHGSNPKLNFVSTLYFI